jgi:hypothetical protein
VTLAEAYQYAFSRTVNATASTLIGPQHPVYDYRLSGQGDLVLTRLDGAAALIETPPGFDRLLLVDSRSREVIVELGPRAARRVAVPAGRYTLLGWRGGQLSRATVDASLGQSSLVPADGLRDIVGAAAAVKGPPGLPTMLESSPPGPGWSLFTGLGLEQPAAATLDTLPALRLALAGGGSRAATATVDLASGRGPGFRESRVEVLVGVQQRWTSGPLGLAAGVEAGGGGSMQTVAGQGRRGSGLALAALTGSVSVPLGDRLALALTAQAPVLAIRRQGGTAVLARPAAWLGMVIRP